MSAGHWLKREFYTRKTRKVFGHYQELQGNEPSNRTSSKSATDEPVMKPQGLFQQLQSKGVWVAIILAVAIVLAYCIIHFT